MAPTLRAIGIEAFYEGPDAQQARLDDLPPEVVAATGAAPPPADAPSLRLRVFADLADGSRVQSDGESMAALLLLPATGEAPDEAWLLEAAQTAAESVLSDDEWIDELRELVPEALADKSLSAARRLATVDEASVRAQAQRGRLA